MVMAMRLMRRLMNAKIRTIAAMTATMASMEFRERAFKVMFMDRLLLAFSLGFGLKKILN